jgi:hypothetical protein
MMLSSNATEWRQMSVSAGFDDFRLTAGDATCPADSDPLNP